MNKQRNGSSTRRTGLRAKILVTLLPSLLPMGIIVLYGYVNGWNAMRTQVGHLSRLAVRDGTIGLNAFLELSRMQFEAWIGEDNKDKFGLHIQLESVGVAGVEMTRMLPGASEFLMLVLTDTEGNVIVAHAPGADPRFFLRGQRAPEALSFLHQQHYGVHFMHSSLLRNLDAHFNRTYIFGYPTRDTSFEINGCLLAYLDWRQVESRLDEIAERFHQSTLENTRVALVDVENGQMIYSAAPRPGTLIPSSSGPVDPEPLSPDLLEWLRNPAHRGATHRFAANGAGDHVTFWPMHDPQSLRVTAAASGLDKLRRNLGGTADAHPALKALPPRDALDSRLIVLAQIPEGDFSGDARRYLAVGLTLGLTAILLTSFALWSAGGAVTHRIRLTVDKLKDITEGGADLTRRLKVDTSDELGDLAESMNAFLGRLQHIMSDLRESQERYLALFNNSMKLVFELQLDGRFIRANARALNLLGTNEATLGESSFVDAVVPAHAPRAREVLQFVAANGFDESIHQFRLNGANGDAPWVEVTGVRLDKDRRPYALLLVGSDMTAQKRAEDEKRQLEAHLRHTQRMEAIGRLAGGIAHDFNNLLSGIIGYANLLKLDARPGTEAYDGLDVIERAGQRAAELTKQLLGFARRGKLQNTTVDIHRTINDVVALLSRTIDKQITLECALRAEQAFVQGDPSQLEQVIMNLAVNAVDAMPGGGSVRFATDVVSNGKTPADLRQDLDMGPFLRIRVADSGGGIPEDIRERIFEPFFTTKEKGKGTGMGLATVYGIVKNHGGAVGLRSVVERGTVFCVYLPLAAPPAPAVKPEGSLTIARGTGRILVVDDESAVRRVLAAMLTRFGYQVETAEDGMKAVEVYHRRGESIDLVIIDMTMPVMNGSDCFRRLRELNPEVKVILATGHALEGSAQQLLDEGVQGFVQKPFVAAAMAQEIARILDGSTLNQPTATR